MSQVTGVVAKSSSTTSLVAKNGISINFGLEATDIGYEAGYTSLGTGWAFSATSAVEPDYISFRNGGAASGYFAVTTTHTIVDITFKNDGTTAVRPVLSSTILPAGMGLFVAGGSCLNGLTACSPDGSAIGAATFADFLPSGVGSFGNALAGASFDFKVLGDGVPIYSLAGDLALVRNGSGINELITNLSAAQAALDGFKVNSPAGSEQEYGVQWDATPFLVDFAAGSILDPGESGTLRYETTVTSFSQASCLILPDQACLLAYSAFGDPIGRGGGSDPKFARAAFSAFSEPALLRQFTPSEDDPLGIRTFKLATPTFKDGTLTFGAPAAVPEPATWLFMVSGTAFAGGFLRRRKTAPALRVH
ncbi:MAG: PEP-CTERM sorting domain-containing protein [Sphingomonadales bacterium]|nr:PEP-CTERM sorting domain-containing protein [Sphingomonadales bacterium]